MKTVLLIVLAIYFLSIWGSYTFVQKAFSKNGRWSMIHTDRMDLFVMFCPGVNTICAIDFLRGGWKEPSEKKNFDKFFKVEK